MNNEMVIDDFRGEYFFLSNFYSAEVTYEGYTYKNNEAAFQAQKDLSRREEFINLNPMMSKIKGKKVKLRDDWNEVKVSIMEEIVRCKFDQNPNIKEKLINTKGKTLIEGNKWNDTFWGMCNGKGENILGKILMKLREEYIKEL